MAILKKTPPTGLSDAELADWARAQGSAAGTLDSLAANTAVGQQNNVASAAANAGASGAVSGSIGPGGRTLTTAELMDMARSTGAARGAADSLGANVQQGTQNQVAGATAASSASAKAALPASAPVLAPAPAAAPKAPFADKANPLYGSYLDQIAAGVNSDKPLPGTAAAISANREALATYAKSAEARAGMTAAKNGSLGQGTANTMGQAVRSDVLGQLANTELKNTQLVSDEKQKLLDAARQAGQFEQTRSQDQQRIDNQDSQFKTSSGQEQQRINNQSDQFGRTLNQNQGQFDANLEQNKSQFNATLEQRKSEFDKNFDSNTSNDYRNTLERLAQDKLTNYLLDGKTGAVGNFTPEEVQQMKELAAKKTTQDDKLTSVYNTILDSLGTEVKNKGVEEQAAAAKAEEARKVEELTKKMNGLTGTQSLAPEDFKTLEANGAIPKYGLSEIPTGKAGYDELKAKTTSGIISIGGEQYHVTGGGTKKVYDSGSDPFSSDLHIDYTTVVNAAGETKYIWGTDHQLHYRAPKMGDEK
jgi:hypothetical protein